jgi:hypothetical protein
VIDRGETGGTGSAVLDAPSAVEFMREALIKISEEEISAIAAELEEKHAAMRPSLEAARLEAAPAEAARHLLGSTFATRRRAGAILEGVSAEELGAAIHALVHGGGDVTTRFMAFDQGLDTIAAPARREFAGECLRFADPDRYWLWARWMWDPKAETGALPLVLVTEYDLHGSDAGSTYGKVGAAVQAVVETADEIGFNRLRATRFAVDVYLAAIYGVYLYTVTRMRMTQEFNKVIPELPALVRRLLAVNRLEAGV